MAEYLTPVDIGNRALQHCGVPRITAFTDDMKGAAEAGFTYDKVRIAELRRNAWRFSIRKAALRAIGDNTMFLDPAAYQAANTYPEGAIVAWQDAIYFASTEVPISTPPDSNPAYWTIYFGPLTAEPWDSTVAYYSGELVYVLSNNVVSVYMSLLTGNSDDPTAIAAWDSGTTYFKGDTVTYSAATWQSKADLNIGNTPVVGAYWDAIPVTQSDSMAGQNWLKLDAALIHQRIDYPIQAGPRNQSTTRNVFRLPNGFLREAPQDSKQGIVSYLGAPSGLPYDDWVLEGNWLVSRDEQVIILRFVADVADVTLMDPMFCEGFAARLALEIVEPLTQSNGKLQTISQVYRTFMGEARAVNGIETGTTEPPLDDYISARL